MAGDTAAIFRAIVQQCNDIFECASILLVPSTGAVGELLSFASARARASSLQAAWPPNMTLSQEEIETARWSYAYSAPAGRGTRVKAELDMTLQPLDTADGTVAVVAASNFWISFAVWSVIWISPFGSTR